MKFVQHSVRLPLVLDKALRHVAHSRQTTPYALLQECVRAGLAALSGEQTAPQLTDEIMQGLGGLTARLAHVERLTERTLFVACAAYVFARTAVGHGADESKLTQAIQDAFSRQLKLAGDA